MTTEMAVRLLPGVPMEQYVIDAFHPGGATLSSSIAHRLLTRSPLHAWTAHPRLNPSWEADLDRAFDLGTAAHAVLLEGRGLFTVDFLDYRTKQAQAVRDEAKAAGKLPVLPHQAQAIEQMVDEARRKLVLSPDLEGIPRSSLVAEQTILWQEGGTWCRCRPDWITTDHGLIVSYKTTAANAEPNAFIRILMGSGYDVQAAFELAGVKAATGVDAKYLWLVQEVEPPYACSLIGLSPMLYDLAHRKYARSVWLWTDCLTAGAWPGYPDRICYVDPPDYAVSQWADRHIYSGVGTVEDL